MRNRLHLALAIALLSARPVVAQQATAWRDSAQQLSVAMKALGDSLVRGDSSTTEVARRGDLAVAASPDQRANAVRALDEFARVRDRWFRGAMPSRDGFRITLRLERASGGRIAGVGSLVLAGLPDTGASLRTQRTTWTAVSIANLIDRYGEMMIGSVPGLAKWIEHPPPLSMDEAERRQLSMYDLVTGVGPMQRRCVAGDLVACRFALDIEHAPTTEPGAVFPTFMHTDFLYFTLDLGGDGAWQRLRDAATESAGPGLAAAAKMPLDSLIARWRNGLMVLRPTTSTIAGRSVLIAVAWTALILLGTLGASKWA